MKNLREETIKAIEDADHTTGDVAWVGTDDGEYAISWDEFTKISNFLYDNDFGSAHIPMDLVVKFHSDDWLERGLADGWECWQYNCLPKAGLAPKKFDFMFEGSAIFGTHDEQPDGSIEQAHRMRGSCLRLIEDE